MPLGRCSPGLVFPGSGLGRDDGGQAMWSDALLFADCQVGECELRVHA